MTSLQLTPAQLRQAANLKEKIIELERQLASILGATSMPAPGKPLHWTQTPAGRARMDKIRRKRWQKPRPPTKTTPTPPAANGKKLHWTQTPAGKLKMDKIRAKRWQNR